MTDIMSFRIHPFINQQEFKIKMSPFPISIAYTNEITSIHIFHKNFVCTGAFGQGRVNQANEMAQCIKVQNAELAHEFNSLWRLTGEKRELILASCPVTSTHVPEYMYTPHTKQQTHD